jgi:DnaJ-domain-containing protein 1
MFPFFRQLAKFPFLFVNDGKMGKAKERKKERHNEREKERKMKKYESRKIDSSKYQKASALFHLYTQNQFYKTLKSCFTHLLVKGYFCLCKKKY